MRVIQRKIEASVGGMLFKTVKQQAMKKSKLLSKTVFLPQSKITMNYLERSSDEECEAGDENPTLLFCHGITDQAKNLCAFITSLDIPENVRILIPDAIGHGKDLERAKKDSINYQQPTSIDILNSTIEFLEVLGVKNSRCNVFGISMGGALAYFLRYKRPDLCQKAVLVSPALEYCIENDFIDDFQSGRKNHFCFESRQDVKILFRDLSSPNRQKQNPVPKFFLETIFRYQQKNAPPGHFRGMLETFLEQFGKSFMSVDHDVDEDSPRLVIWPENDFICNHQKGKDFFRNSKSTTLETIQNCGHVFHSDGTLMYDVIKPLVSKYLLDFQDRTNAE